MARTISAQEAKNRLGSVLGYVNDQGDEVIVTRRGKPTAVIMSIAASEELQAFREEKNRRAEALERLRRLHERLAAHNRVHNADLSEEEAIELSVRVGRELIDRLAERVEITFERDLRKRPS